MIGRLTRSLLLLGALALDSTEVFSQKRDLLKPPPETASLAETQQWLLNSITKYASYKTRLTSVAISAAKFDGCTLSFTQTRKLDSTSSAVMGATRRTSTTKFDMSVDLSKLRDDGITLQDHIYPEVQTLQLWHMGFDLTEGSSNGQVVEIVVKYEAADAIKTALAQARRLCTEKN